MLLIKSSLYVDLSDWLTGGQLGTFITSNLNYLFSTRDGKLSLLRRRKNNP